MLMKTLRLIGQVFERIVSTITTTLVVALLVIVCLQVVARNLFAFNLGTLAEYPVYLMIWSVWIGAILVAKADNHLSIEFVDLFIKNKKALQIINIAMSIIVAVALGIFAYYGFRQVIVLYGRQQIDPGTKLPIWFLQFIVPLSAAFQFLYYCINISKKIRRLIEK